MTATSAYSLAQSSSSCRYHSFIPATSKCALKWRPPRKTGRFRDQWTKLGEQWREKAAADEHHQECLHTATRNLTPTFVLEAPPVQKPEATANCASASELRQQGHEAGPTIKGSNPYSRRGPRATKGRTHVATSRIERYLGDDRITYQS